MLGRRLDAAGTRARSWASRAAATAAAMVVTQAILDGFSTG
jgi:hypothetical protein